MTSSTPLTRILSTLALCLAALGLVQPAAGDPPVADGLALWLDASQLTGLADGQQVDTWTDMSGSGNSAILQTGSTKYIASVINGLPAVRFSGGEMMNVNLSSLANNSYEVFVVEGRRNANAGYIMCTRPASANQALHIGYRNNTQFTLAQWANDLEFITNSIAYPPQIFQLWLKLYLLI